jgi:hypothetical protein
MKNQNDKYDKNNECKCSCECWGGCCLALLLMSYFAALPAISLAAVAFGGIDLSDFNSFTLYSLECKRPNGIEKFNSTIFVEEYEKNKNKFEAFYSLSLFFACLFFVKYMFIFVLYVNEFTYETNKKFYSYLFTILYIIIIPLYVSIAVLYTKLIQSYAILQKNIKNSGCDDLYRAGDLYHAGNKYTFDNPTNFILISCLFTLCQPHYILYFYTNTREGCEARRNKVQQNIVRQNVVRQNVARRIVVLSHNKAQQNEARQNEVLSQNEARQNEVLSQNEARQNEALRNEVLPNEVLPNEVLPNEVLSQTHLQVKMSLNPLNDPHNIPKIYYNDPHNIPKIDYNKIPLYDTKISVNDTPGKNLCIICLIGTKNIIGEPCNHVLLCEECYSTHKDKFINYPCPMCRGNIVALKKIFF